MKNNLFAIFLIKFCARFSSQMHRDGFIFY